MSKDNPMFDLAIRLRDALRAFPKAIKVEIAGSLRRRRPDPHDIEICALVAPEPDLFGDDPERPTPVLKDYLKSQAQHVAKNGPKYSQYLIQGITLDYFQTADPAQWGMLFFIRTGSATFVRNALTEWKRMNHWKGCCKGNILFKDYGQSVATPTEEDVFTALGWPFRPPKERE